MTTIETSRESNTYEGQRKPWDLDLTLVIRGRPPVWDATYEPVTEADLARMRHFTERVRAYVGACDKPMGVRVQGYARDHQLDRDLPYWTKHPDREGLVDRMTRAGVLDPDEADEMLGLMGLGVRTGDISEVRVGRPDRLCWDFDHDRPDRVDDAWERLRRLRGVDPQSTGYRRALCEALMQPPEWYIRNRGRAWKQIGLRDLDMRKPQPVTVTRPMADGRLGWWITSRSPTPAEARLHNHVVMKAMKGGRYTGYYPTQQAEPKLTVEIPVGGGRTCKVTMYVWQARRLIEVYGPAVGLDV